MSDFSTAAHLDLIVSDQALRQVRGEIEDELGAIPIGTTDNSTMSAQAARRGSAGSGPSTRRMMRRDQNRNEYLEDQTLYLESIDDSLSEGGLLGGGGGGLAAEVLGIAGDVGTEAAGTAAETATGLATDIAGTALGQAAGSVISDRIANTDVAVEDTTIPVTPNPLPVSGGGGGATTLSPTINTSTNFSPTFRPTFKPELSPDFSTELSPDLDLPDLALDFGGGSGMVRVDESQLPLAVEETTLPVEEPTIELSLAERAPRRGAFQRGGDAVDDFSAGVTDFFLPGDAPDSISEPLNEGGTPLGRPAESLGRFIDTVNPTTSGGYGSSGSGSATVENNVDADVRPNITINIDTNGLLDDVERAIEDANDEVRRELLDEIRGVEADLNDLERQLSGGGRVR